MMKNNLIKRLQLTHAGPLEDFISNFPIVGLTLIISTTDEFVIQCAWTHTHLHCKFRTETNLESHTPINMPLSLPKFSFNVYYVPYHVCKLHLLNKNIN